MWFVKIEVGYAIESDIYLICVLRSALIRAALMNSYSVDGFTNI